MNATTRRAFHEALDIVLDALAKDAGAAPAVVTKRRRRPEKVREMPDGVDTTTVEKARAALKKAGL